MKKKIKEAIQTTLVIENKQSLDLAIDKIINSICSEIDNKIEQEKYVAENPKGYHPQDVHDCRFLLATFEQFKTDLKK